MGCDVDVELTTSPFTTMVSPFLVTMHMVCPSYGHARSRGAVIGYADFFQPSPTHIKWR